MRHHLLVIALALPGCEPAKTGETGGGEDTDTASGGESGESGEGGGERVALTINEFQASNGATLQDVDGAYPDWVELYNMEAEELSLAGFTMTDDMAEPGKHTLGALTVPAGGYLVLLADGDVDQGEDHLGFSLDADGGQLALYDAEGRALARLEYEPQATDWSAARVPDGSTTWVATQTPTPGAANAASE